MSRFSEVVLYRQPVLTQTTLMVHGRDQPVVPKVFSMALRMVR